MYFKKRFCHHSTGKESVTLGNVCRQGGQEDLAQTVWTGCHRRSWCTSPCHVPRRGKAEVRGVVRRTAAHATSKPGSSTWFDDIPIESIEDVPIVVEDLP